MKGKVEDYVKQLIDEYNLRDPTHQHSMVVASEPKFLIYEERSW